MKKNISLFNFKLHINYGFTLIELLVVVALIGLLSSIILTYVNGARAKGANGTVQANLLSARDQAELFYNSNSFVYTGVCTNGMVGQAQAMGAQIQGAAKAVGLTGYTINGTGTLLTATCNATSLSWAAEVPLRNGGMWCIDNIGASRYETTSIGSTTICP